MAYCATLLLTALAAAITAAERLARATDGAQRALRADPWLLLPITLAAYVATPLSLTLWGLAAPRAVADSVLSSLWTHAAATIVCFVAVASVPIAQLAAS